MLLLKGKSILNYLHTPAPGSQPSALTTELLPDLLLQSFSGECAPKTVNAPKASKLHFEVDNI